jgi:hypothetical protein
MAAHTELFEEPRGLYIPDHARFWRASRAVAERARFLFNDARSYGQDGYVRVFRHALEVVDFTDEEKSTYEAYLKLDVADAVELGWERPVTPQQMRVLASESDPAIAVIAATEAIRPQHPNFQRDQVGHSLLFTSYVIFASGVHHYRTFE